MLRYRIEVGHADGVRPGNIVGAIANEGGISGSEIGPIEIRDSYSTISAGHHERLSDSNAASDLGLG